jgi:opacity protein-like surface antigen
MRILSRLACAGAVVLMAAGPVSAQDERGFVRGLGGVTFGNVQTSSIFGGGGGISVGRGFSIVGEFGRIQNVLPNEVADLLDDLELLLEIDSGLDIEVSATAPAFYGAGGIRYAFPTAGRLQPFVEALLGAANVSIDATFVVDGIDFSEELEDEADLESETEFLIAFGGGLAFGLSDGVGIDVAYRYHGIQTDDPTVHASAVYVGLRIVFR